MITEFIIALLAVCGILAIVWFITEKIKKFLVWSSQQPANAKKGFVSWVKRRTSERKEDKENQLLWDGIKVREIQKAKLENLNNTAELNYFYKKQEYKNAKKTKKNK